MVFLAELRVRRMEWEEHEGLEAARLVLDLADRDEVLQPLLDRLDMAVHDGGIRADAEAVRRLHRLDPLRRRRLLRADDLAHAVREDFRSAARQAVEAVFLEQCQDLADALARHLGEVDDLDRRERLDVCLRQCRLDLPHDSAVIRERLVGMQR